MKKKFDTLSYDFPAAIVVTLIALPLCIGIAIASGAPVSSGIISGIIGGIVVGSLSQSSFSVSGPAAGLIVIVIASLNTLNSYNTFLLSVIVAGLIQLFLGFIKAGYLGYFFPSSVVKGMLAAIGLTLILSQIPHALGYDVTLTENDGLINQSGQNMFGVLVDSFSNMVVGSIIISAICFLFIILWDRYQNKNALFKHIPSSLLAVVVAVIINYFFGIVKPDWVLIDAHLVSIPLVKNFSQFVSEHPFPDFSQVLNLDVYTVALTIAVVASLESLLSLEAIDKMDPHKRISSKDQELKAQGAGNLLSGLLGGLPMTSVVVRSSANIDAGAQTKNSTILQGILLAICFIILPRFLNLIPLSALAIILIIIGYKLCSPKLFRSMYAKGNSQFIPFATTILGILFTDLLTGIIIGVIVGMLFVLKSNYQTAISLTSDNSFYLLRFKRDVSFLNKARVKNTLSIIPDNSYLIIDGTRSNFIDNDIIETLQDFIDVSQERNIKIEIKASRGLPNPLTKNLKFDKLEEEQTIALD